MPGHRLRPAGVWPGRLSGGIPVCHLAGQLRSRVRARAVHAAGAAAGPDRDGGPMGRPRAAEPSWGSVLVTTVRLWTQRWLGRWWPGQTRWRVAIVAALAAVIFVAGAAMAV